LTTNTRIPRSPCCNARGPSSGLYAPFLIVILLALAVCSRGAIGADSSAQFIEGLKRHEAGDLAACESSWRNLHRDELYGPIVLILLGRASRSANNLEKGEYFYREFAKNHPSSAYVGMVRREMAELLVQQGKADGVSILTGMIQGANGKSRAPLIMLLAQLEAKLGNHSKATAHFKRLTLDFPASVEGLVALEQLAVFTQASRMPKVVYSEREDMGRARLLYEGGRFDLAGDVYERLLKAKPTDNPLKIKLATCRYKQRKNLAAIGILKDLLKANPPGPIQIEAYYLLTRLYWRMERDKDFEAYSRKVLESGNDRFKKMALFNLGAYHLEKGQYERAIECFQGVVKSGSDQRMKFQAHWKIAWARYLTGSYQAAADGFAKLRTIASPGDTENACQYWQARSLMNMNKTKESMALLEDLTDRCPTTYYGYAAGDFLKSLGNTPRSHRGEAARFPDITLSTTMKSQNNIRQALVLNELKLHEFAMVNLDAVPRHLQTEPAVAFLRARCAYLLGHYPKARSILSASFGKFLDKPPVDAPPDFIEIAYPRVYYDETMRQADKHGVDPHLVWSVMRQESLYDAAAVSPAGALGLMQVTPQASGLVGITGRPSKAVISKLLDPQNNLAIGTQILARNLTSFQGKVIPALASYNADIKKVRSWVQKNSLLKSDEFIEAIPYQETRTYVKKVLAGYRTYRMVHNRKELAGLW